MQPIPFPKVTRTLGKEQGYIPLPIMDTKQLQEQTTGETILADVMVSLWVPSDEERAAIAAGMAIVLSVTGTTHPPVMLSVLAKEGSIPAPKKETKFKL